MILMLIIHHGRLPSGKLTWQWKIPILCRKYIFQWSISYCYVSFPECNGWSLHFERKRWSARNLQFYWGPANGALPTARTAHCLRRCGMPTWPRQYRPRRHMILCFYVILRVCQCITCISYADIIHVVQNRQNRIYLIERKMRRDVECRFSMFNLFQTTWRPLSQLDCNSSHGWRSWSRAAGQMYCVCTLRWMEDDSYSSYYSLFKHFYLQTWTLCQDVETRSVFGTRINWPLMESKHRWNAAKVWRQCKSDMQSNRGWAARGGWFQQRWTGRNDRNHEFGWWNLRYWRWMWMKQVQWNSRTVVFLGYGMIWYVLVQPIQGRDMGWLPLFWKISEAPEGGMVIHVEYCRDAKGWGYLLSMLPFWSFLSILPIYGADAAGSHGPSVLD